MAPYRAVIQPRLTRTAKIRALAPGEAVSAALSPLPFVKGVAPGPAGTYVVSYEGDEQTLAAVVRALVLSGVSVIGVEPERNELERIFLEVTRGEVQ